MEVIEVEQIQRCGGGVEWMFSGGGRANTVVKWRQ